jgi:methionyl-tRNA formyltransferase
LDAGPILLQRAVQLGERETAPELLSRLSDIGAKLICETLRKLNEIEPKPQLEAEATFAPILSRAHGLIDWANEAAAIERRVRGLQPWPNAYTLFKSRRLIIWEAHPVQAGELHRDHGRIMKAAGDEMIVSAGNSTALRIGRLQLEGSRQMSARDFINGHHLQAGDLLG